MIIGEIFTNKRGDKWIVVEATTFHGNDSPSCLKLVPISDLNPMPKLEEGDWYQSYGEGLFVYTGMNGLNEQDRIAQGRIIEIRKKNGTVWKK